MFCSITVEMDNAAFADRPGDELARILRRMADMVEGGAAANDMLGLVLPVKDINGNMVGTLSVEHVG